MRRPVWADLEPSAVLPVGRRLQVEGGGGLADLTASLEQQLGLAGVSIVVFDRDFEDWCRPSGMEDVLQPSGDVRIRLESGTPAAAAPAAAAADAGTLERYQSAPPVPPNLQRLLEMGYGLAVAVEALRRADGGLAEAVGLLAAGLVLEHAAAELQGDREVVLAAVAQDGGALVYAAEGLRGDREVVLAAVAQDGGALGHAAEGLRGDREVVLAAVAQYGQSAGLVLEHAAAELQGDREVVLAAVAQDGGALVY
eukprot:SAG22_NODE_4161_length_1362_cov_19.376880_3_plen_253_part_01